MSMLQLLNQAVTLKALRPLDSQFAMMVADDDQPAVMLAAALLSHESGEGHVCLPLERIKPAYLFAGKHSELVAQLFAEAEPAIGWESALLAAHSVSSDDEATPLKLIGNRLYLNRMWSNEQRVAAFFGEHNQPVVVDESQLRNSLNALFGASQQTDWQKVAAAVALTQRISVISGGPGTGKTTTVAKLLAALVQLSDGQPLRIQLAAPTGKAAARLTESLGSALRQLPLSDEQKKRLPDEASTLHSLLGAQPNSQRLRHHAGNPLHLDVLVVDEASMVDLPMMSRLTDALPERARVIFLGDRDQLASVEAGAVLGDICHYVNDGYSAQRAEQLHRLTGCEVPVGESARASALRDGLCLLRKSYRYDSQSGIGQLAFAVNASDSRQVKAVFGQGFTDISLQPLLEPEDYTAMIADVVSGYGEYLQQVRQKAEPAEILSAFSRYQLLCALREGPFGVSGLNERIEQAHLIPRPSQALSRWYDGRPVMIARNDRSLGLFNGDIGIALLREEGLRVWFPMPDGTVKSVQPSRLPEHDTAFAMTVHKSQGSEFDHAALVLPSQFVPVVTRELVYTAITRARKQLSLYADERVLNKAIATRTERRSGLMAIFAGE